ncbi:DUF1611 domain-containing protein [Planctomicrobium sp. SH527]|uniref:DUF1611 domain-containing protein n=1 Tax=Planctomicrobium sp. SH527 TaxID=3448123 RepID=UPI003F5B0CFA
MTTTTITPPPASTSGSSPLNTILGYRRIAIAMGENAPLLNSKTAISLLRYRGSDCIAIIDPAHAGKTAQELYGIGGETPFVSQLDEVDSPDAIFIGISPAGGELPASLRPTIIAGVRQGLDVISGLHDFLVDDPEISALAEQSGSLLIDVRKNNYHKTAKAVEFRPECLRIHAVGHDCSVGKMVTTLELEKGLKARDVDAKFLATGQTGIMIVGNGVPVDCVVSDFVNGAVENLVVENQQHDVLLIEGQGSITHPAFSAVTMGLLHGSAPQGLIFCYEAGRTHVKGLLHIPLKSIETYLSLYETIGSQRFPTEVIGIAMNGRYLTPEAAELEKQAVQKLTGLPVCDVYRDGAEVLVDAILKLKERLQA